MQGLRQYSECSEELIGYGARREPCRPGCKENRHADPYQDPLGEANERLMSRNVAKGRLLALGAMRLRRRTVDPSLGGAALTGSRDLVTERNGTGVGRWRRMGRKPAHSIVGTSGRRRGESFQGHWVAGDYPLRSTASSPSQARALVAELFGEVPDPCTLLLHHGLNGRALDTPSGF